jgi:hypothetical protein
VAEREEEIPNQNTFELCWILPKRQFLTKNPKQYERGVILEEESATT